MVGATDRASGGGGSSISNSRQPTTVHPRCLGRPDARCWQWARREVVLVDLAPLGEQERIALEDELLLLPASHPAQDGLRLLHVSKRFESVQALADCSFSVGLGGCSAFSGRTPARRPLCGRCSVSLRWTARSPGAAGRSASRSGCTSATCRRSAACIHGCLSASSSSTSPACTGLGHTGLAVPRRSGSSDSGR